jgi:hypothetical protein
MGIQYKYVLYFVYFLAGLTIIQYILIRNINAIIFFILNGYLMTFVTKNRIIILMVPIVLSRLFMYVHLIKEGFEDNLSDTDYIKNLETPSKTKSSKDTSVISKNQIIDTSSDHPEPTENLTTYKKQDSAFKEQPEELIDIFQDVNPLLIQANNIFTL